MSQNKNNQSSSQQQDESTQRDIINNTAGTPQSEVQRETAEMREQIQRDIITLGIYLDEVINTLQNIIDRLSSNLSKNSSEQSKSLYQK
jgi:Mg2+ and Co2+ transporter CorA